MGRLTSETAWNDAIYSWKNYHTDGQDFLTYIGDYFHAHPNLITCSTVGQEGCSDSIVCGEGTSANAVVNSPAGYLILNGFIGIHTGWNSYYEALQIAQVIVLGKVGTFSSIFAPFYDESEALKIALDLFGFAFALTSSFVFTTCKSIAVCRRILAQYSI